jgi:hypothetical protein
MTIIILTKINCAWMFVVYAVETVIAQKLVGNTLMSLVKWKGYGAKYNTWEPSCNIVLGSQM